jgi:hypothetical protein
LHAKKSTKKAKKAKGFGKSPSPPSNPAAEDLNSTNDRLAKDATTAAIASETLAASSARGDQDRSKMTEDDVFKKYGISNEGPKVPPKKQSVSAGAPEDSPFGAAVLANIPMKTQLQIDNFLITATFASLAFCVLCGVGISTSAIKVAIPGFSLPEWADSVVVSVLDPAFTPSFFIFFFFSITFGVFKFAQVSSSQTVYREVDKQ